MIEEYGYENNASTYRKDLYYINYPVKDIWRREKVVSKRIFNVVRIWWTITNRTFQDGTNVLYRL